MADSPAGRAKQAADFPGAFAALKKILKRHGAGLVARVDTPEKYHLYTPEVVYRGKPMFYGAVEIKKNYVSYHLMPVYSCPELMKSVSPELEKRKQGKACFNFVAPDDKMFAELDKLTEAGFQRFRAMDWDKLMASVSGTSRTRRKRKTCS